MVEQMKQKKHDENSPNHKKQAKYISFDNA